MTRGPADAAFEEHEPRRARLLALLHAAAAAFPDPRSACAWLHADHPALFGASPVLAEWHGERTARYAALVLAADTSPRGTPSVPRRIASDARSRR